MPKNLTNKAVQDNQNCRGNNNLFIEQKFKLFLNQFNFLFIPLFYDYILLQLSINFAKMFLFMSHAQKTLDNKFKLYLNANNLNKYTEKQRKTSRCVRITKHSDNNHLLY